VRHCKQFRTVIQAGGNIGIWPVSLAQLFAQVITAEPDEVNYEALCLNTRQHANICAINAAFGREPSRAAVLAHEPGNIGAHRMVEGDEVGVMRIDDLAITDCDLLQLDIEGYEFFALQGAAKTIAASSPVICLELKGLGCQYGTSDRQVTDLLAELNYSEVLRIHRDVIYSRS
jgi:FkbM family methyltransferase